MLDSIALAISKRLNAYRTRTKSRLGCIPDNIVTTEYLVQLWEQQKGLCHYLNKPISFECGATALMCANLDKIDPSLGYVEGNVVWASRFANNGRNDTDYVTFLNFLINNEIVR